MAERPDVRSRLLQPGRGTGAPTTFVLEPAMGGRAIPLLDGDNIIEVDSSVQGIGGGLDTSKGASSSGDVKPQAGVYEKQVLLRTTKPMPRGSVMLKAFRDVRVRERQSISSASPQKTKPSPSPGKRAQASPGRTQASPGRAPRASPSKTASWSGGGIARLSGNAQRYLVVGDTLDLGTGGPGRDFRCRFSFKLQLASSAAAAEAAIGGGSSSGSNGGMKRQLEGPFAGSSSSSSSSGDVHVLQKPPPAAIEVLDDSSDDDGAEAGAEAKAPAPAPAVPKRRRRDRDRSSAGSTPFEPVGVVDLSDAFFDLPENAGKSENQPLDLCNSDEEGDAGGPAAGSGARATPTPSSCSGGGGPSGGGIAGTSTSLKEHLEPERRAPPPTRIEDVVSEPAAPAAVDADLSLVGAARPTTIENDQPDVPPPSRPPPPSSPFRSLELKPAPSPRTQRPPLGEKSVQTSVVAPCHAVAGGGDGSGGAARPIAPSSTSATRTLTCMHDEFRDKLKFFVKEYYQHSAPVVDEFLACGTAPPSTLARATMAALLKSRCSVGNECLRRQLRAMLDVDPDCWEPPEGNAPGWFEEVMRGATTGKTSTRPKDEPSDAVLEAHAIALEVALDYLAAGRRTPPLPLQDGGPSRSVMLFFPERNKKTAQPRKTPEKSKSKSNPTQAQKNAQLARQQAQLAKQNDELARRDAQEAVETSAAWAVGVWGLAGVAGVTARTGDSLPRQWWRRDTPALARARLLAARLLAEVVEACGLPTGEACGLPVREACAAIRHQMDLFSPVPAVGDGVDHFKGIAGCRAPAAAAAADAAAGGGAAAPGLGAAGAKEAGCRGLSPAGRGGLVRALFGRPFLPELARGLRDDLGGAGVGSPREDVGGIDRLRALLSRVVRKAEGGSTLLLSSAGS